MKERLQQFIDYKGFSIRKFALEVGVSHSLLSKESALGSDKLVKIWDTYPEINLDWILTGRGEMLYSEPKMLVGTDGEGAQIAVQVLKDEILDLHRKLLICHEQKDNLVTGYMPLNMNEPEVAPGK